MRIVVLDSVGHPANKGVGSPAQFSRHVIEYLRALGHEITIEPTFDEASCAEADAVWSEWCNEVAYEAAASGLCKKLILRMRGYDVWGPLEKLQWENVDALVYESPFMETLAEERCGKLKLAAMMGSKLAHVLPSGVDLENIPFRKRKHGPVVALVARAIADKGYQLAFEWARQRPDIQLHVTCALGDDPVCSRLMRYLHHTKPNNVTIHGTVDTVKWLDEIDANYLLSASNWETLGYTIAEAMAMGIKPLIHDTPGAVENWGLVAKPWRDFGDLNRAIAAPYLTCDYRAFVHYELNAAKLSPRFAELVLAPSTRDTSRQRAALSRQHYEYANTVFTAVRTAIDRRSNMAAIAALVSDFRARLEPHSLTSPHRYGSALGTAVAYYNHGDFAQAEVWALRAMLDYARPDALALLGDAAEGRGDVEEAVQWYKAACAVDDTPNRYRFPDLVNERHGRLRKLEKAAAVELPATEPPKRLIVIVTVRNGEKWIERCLRSIQAQPVPFTCIVVDDVSTDRTALFAEHFVGDEDHYDDNKVFAVVRNTERKWQARNTVEMARRYAESPEDVVVLIDGDDWLTNEVAFIHLIAAYSRGAWMTYGQLVESDGHPTRFGVYPKRIAESGRFADWPWCATPPRSFKRFLLDACTDDDFKLDGEWPKVAGDICVILPMLQLACERAMGITVPIYGYNVETDDSDHKTDPYEQTRVRDLFLARPQKARLVR